MDREDLPQVVLAASASREASGSRDYRDWFASEGNGLDARYPVNEVLLSARDRLAKLRGSEIDPVCCSQGVYHALYRLRKALFLKILIVERHVLVLEDLERSETILGGKVAQDAKESCVCRSLTEATADSHYLVETHFCFD